MLIHGKYGQSKGAALLPCHSLVNTAILGAIGGLIRKEPEVQTSVGVSQPHIPMAVKQGTQ